LRGALGGRDAGPAPKRRGWGRDGRALARARRLRVDAEKGAEMARVFLAVMLAWLALPAAGQDVIPGTEADCIDAGGRWDRGGLARQFLCFLPTPDAGEACETADDCTGYCLAETLTCSTETPMFDCFAVRDLDAAVVTLCVD